MNGPVIGKNFKSSKTGRKWKWCFVRKCWMNKGETFKIYLIDGLYTCSSYQTWHDGTFTTFDLVEQECLHG